MIVLILSLFFSWFFIGGIFKLSFDSFFLNKIETSLHSTLINYLSANIPLIVLFIFSIFTTHIVLKSTIIDMVRDEKYEIKNYILTIIIAFLFTTIFTFFFNKNISINSKPLNIKIVMAFVVILITPIQCFSEEFLFRVSFSRLFDSSKLFQKILLSIFSGIFFLLAHIFSNPEFQIAPSFLLNLYYFQFGFLSMLLGLTLNDFTFSILIHSSINLFSLLICGYVGSPLESAPIFISSQIPSPLFANISIFVIFALTYFCVKKNVGRITCQRKRK